MADDTAGRVYLNVTFHEKDAARALGARWDPDRRQWWASRWTLAANPGLHHWLDAGSLLARQAKEAADFLAGRSGRTSGSTGKGERDKLKKSAGRSASEPVTTPRTDFSLSACECAVPPWEHCQHTEQR